jgi:hypothetical protein
VPFLERRASTLESALQTHKLAILAAFSLIYFTGTILRAHARPFWFDEILTLSAAGQPNVPSLLRAARIVDAMPPLIHLATHMADKLGGEGEVVSRIPGMIGFWIFCLCLFRFAGKRLGILYALAALLLPFASDSYGYSFEARSYGMLLGFGGMALVCWQRAAEGGRRDWALAGLTAALMGAAASHYYAVLFYLPLMAGEAWRTFERRRIDWPVWGAFAAGGLPLVVGALTIREVIRKTQHPWAQVSVRQYLDFYEMEFQHAIPFALLAAVLIALWLWVDRPELEAAPAGGQAKACPTYEMVAAALLLAIPAAGVTVGLAVPPHFFIERYAVLVIAGPALLVPMLVSRLTGGRPAAGAALAIAALVPFLGELAQVRGFTNPLAKELMLVEALRSGPVVVDDGIRFLQLWYYAPPELKSRLLYVGDIPSSVRYLGIETIDLNLFAAARVRTLPVISYGDFAAPGKEFLMYVTGGAGWMAPKVIAEGGALEVVDWRRDRALVRVRLPAAIHSARLSAARPRAGAAR